MTTARSKRLRYCSTSARSIPAVASPLRTGCGAANCTCSRRAIANAPSQFNGAGTRAGKWVEVDNKPTVTPSIDGSTGFDLFGYPTQGNPRLKAKELGGVRLLPPGGRGD